MEVYSDWGEGLVDVSIRRLAVVLFRRCCGCGCPVVGRTVRGDKEGEEEATDLGAFPARRGAGAGRALLLLETVAWFTGEDMGLGDFFGRETGKEAAIEIRRWRREEEDEGECSGEEMVVMEFSRLLVEVRPEKPRERRRRRTVLGYLIGVNGGKGEEKREMRRLL
ncbi:hypothetical protein HAX54_027817 [Datura stramonium]|uniref:Uncharacterized protein n=1 Tax=Datura stramonium TaxID=4076 RepID=A0ABS8V608_DATST|nr:hypothetical protein [Datura stramonium]